MKVRNKHVRIGISDRCISIFGKTYSYLTGQSWDFVFQGTETVRNNENSVIQLFNMPFSHLQIAQLQIGKNNALILKNDPSSRKIASLDRRRKDALLFEMLNNEVVLTKLHGDNNKKYWIMMNMQGETVPMDEKMKQVLESKDWTVLRVKQLIDENERPVIVLVLTCYEFRETDEDDQKGNS